MLIDFDFHMLQLRYVKSAAERIDTYRPDGLDDAAIGTRIDDAKAVRKGYIDAKTDFDLSRGSYRQAVNDGHDACVGVYASMKSRYRKDPASLEAINGLPIDDETAAATIKRGEQISSLWGKLPNIATPPALKAPFVAWGGMDKAAFDGLFATIATRQDDLPDKDQGFQLAEGNLHDTDAILADLVTASLVQGRAQFRSGASREVIDAIPTEPASHAPDQAVIAVATSPGPGEAHLEFDANHGTSFDVLHKAPGASAFTKVVDDGILKTYDATGLAAGVHQFEVIGHNSLGDGVASAASSVTVA